MGALRQVKQHAELKKNVTTWNNQLFYKGFLFKSFPFKQIDTSADIKPTHEEIQNFQQTLNKTNVTTMTTEDSSDDEKLDGILKDALMKGGAAIYAKGDKISVNKGFTDK